MLSLLLRKKQHAERHAPGGASAKPVAAKQKAQRPVSSKQKASPARPKDMAKSPMKRKRSITDDDVPDVPVNTHTTSESGTDTKHPCFAPGRVLIGRNLTLGGDCDGLGSGAIALEKLHVPFEHMFASESDPPTRSMFTWNHTVNELLDDSNNVVKQFEKKGTLDLYVAGPPCQPWSAYGKNRGLDDEAGRGMPLQDVFERIKVLKPDCWIIEEVKHITSKVHNASLEDLLSTVKNMKARGTGPLYHVQQQVVDSFLIGGVPQHRERIYIVGWKRTLGNVDDFVWPTDVPTPLLSEILDGGAALNTKKVYFGVPPEPSHLTKTAQVCVAKFLALS